MRSPVAALTWEIWSRNYRSIVSVVVITSLCALVNHLVPNKSEILENYQSIYWLLMIGSLGLVFSVFHHAEFNPRKNWHGFPYRLFTLPVPTWILTGLPMLLGVIGVGLVYFAWTQLVFAPLGRTVSSWPGFVLGVGMLCYQSVVWSLAGFRIVRIVSLCFLGLLFMNFGMIPLFLELLPWDRETVLELFTFLLIGFSMVAFFGAWFSVERQRRGGGRGRGWLKAQAGRIMNAVPRRTAAFSSASSAQFWFEWRRAGWLLPACVALALLFIFLPVSWFGRKDTDIALITLGWVLGLPLILATVIGKGFAKPDFWSADLSLPAFLAIRPFASGEMIVIKMKVAAMSVVIVWALVITFLSLWLPLWANTRELKEWLENAHVVRGGFKLFSIAVLSLMALAIVTWRGMVGSLWVGLSGSMTRFVGGAIVHAIVFVLAICGIVYAENHFHWHDLERYVSWLAWILMSAVVAKVWLAVFSWNKISPPRVGKYVMLWTAGTGCFVALGLLLSLNVFWIKQLIILAALLPVPLARLGFAPASLSRNRHR
ncbi:MAG: hypothetical protein JWM68_1041 [Verrucomicrobiales bacterium]|nr:hypothetical protein [Verrucomicrobiales bacterium]